MKAFLNRHSLRINMPTRKGLYNKSKTSQMASWLHSYSFPRGIKNYGVNCYLNSIFQSLLNLEGFRNFIIRAIRRRVWDMGSNGGDMSSYTGSWFFVFLNLMVKTSGCSRPADPKKLLKHLCDRGEEDGFHANHNQQDAHEFFVFMRNRMNDALKCLEPKDQSNAMNTDFRYQKENEENKLQDITQVFAGETNVQVLCEECDHAVSRVEEWEELVINITPENYKRGPYKSFQKAVDVSTRPIRLEGYTCDNCKEQNTCWKTSTFTHLPENLIVQLSLHTMNASLDTGKLMAKTKIDKNVVFDLYNTKYGWVESVRYKLKSVVLHQGNTLTSGHYFAALEAENGNWFICNDEDVIFDYEGRETNKFLSADESGAVVNPYVLMYVKQE